MGKTIIQIKKRTTNQSPAPQVEASKASPTKPIVKKRGRPPKKKIDKKQDDPMTKKYSLINPSVNHSQSQITAPFMVMGDTRNTIIQLKITKEEIEYYEEYGKFREKDEKINYNLLDTKRVIHQPTAANDWSSDQSKCNHSHQHQHNTQKVTFAIPQRAQLDQSKAKVDVEYRRNMIINSGIKRRVIKLNSAISGDEWPSYSNLLCWNCCHGFETTPVGIPSKIMILKDGSISFELYGNFCSYNCAGKYLCPDKKNLDDLTLINCNLDLSNLTEQTEQLQLLHLLCHLETGMDLNKKIKLAAPRLTLIPFGGKWSIVEYRRNFTQHAEYHVFKTPLVPISYELEETNDIKAQGIPKKIKSADKDDIQSTIDDICMQLQARRKEISNKPSFIEMLKRNSNRKNK